jgi:hypothetical protein
MSNLYVYYQLQVEHIPSARSAVARLFSAARPYCGATRLMQGEQSATEQTNHSVTWMEIYEDVIDVETLQQCLQQSLAESGLLPLIQGQRHSEYFFALA